MKDNKGEHPLGDAGQLVFLVLFLAVWIGDSSVLRFSTFPAEYVPLWIRLVPAACSFAVSLFLVRSGHGVVQGDERPNEVVSSGAFRYVRHPLYLGCILFYVGLAISTLSLLSLALVAVIAFFYNYLAAYEERLLREKFGQAYRDYMIRTGRWVPIAGGGNEQRPPVHSGEKRQDRRTANG